MNLLLDTHALLWFITDDAKLSGPAESAIADSSNDVLISPSSYWELAIKVSIGKYPLNVPFETFMTQAISSLHFVAQSAETSRISEKSTGPTSAIPASGCRKTTL